MSTSLRIHRHPLSGHSHRVQLFASLAGIPHTLVEVDLRAGAHKQPAFLALNPFGQVPVIEDGDVVVADANAILVYLARRYAPEWLPDGDVEAAQVQRFLSLAANELAHGPAAARLVTVFGAGLDHALAQRRAVALFERIEAHLEGRTWLVGNRPSVADVAHYSYTAHAPEGGVDLAPFPRIRDWLARIEALPGFVAMQRTPVALAA